jgi:alginate O-acetyltransferase complex protein AlgJ
MAATAVIFMLPLSLDLLAHLRPLSKKLRNSLLAGVQPKYERLPFTLRSLFDAKYQGSLAERFSGDFIGRTFLIRQTNEIYYRAFNVCPMKSASLVLGRNGVVFEEAYLREYCLTRVDNNNAVPLVRDIKRLQEICGHLGIGFVLVLTPSKAAVFPDDIPARWLRRYDPRPRAYDSFVPLLRSEGIHFVDGHAITAEAKARAPAPVFPRGGTHWSQYAAWLTTNAVMASLQSQGKPLRPIECEELKVSNRPTGEDQDIYALMNLAVPWRYPVAELKIKQTPGQGPRPILAITGGSFVWKIAGLLNESRQFSEMDFFYYYKTMKMAFANGIGTRVAEPVQSVDFEREIFAADCLVLEINEQMLPNPANTQNFVADALKNLPDASKPKAQFLYEFPAK